MELAQQVRRMTLVESLEWEVIKEFYSIVTNIQAVFFLPIFCTDTSFNAALVSYH